MSHPERSWGRALFDFFASLRLTISLLIILSITSIFGTVIPQGDILHEYFHGISQAKLKLYQSLDLFDMYHSWWFIGILVLFTVNLIVCSAKRLPHAWRYISSPAKVLDRTLLDGLSQSLVIPRNSDRFRHDSLQDLLSRKVGAVFVTETDGALHLFSEQNSLSRLAVYVTHLSIIIIFVGSMIGSLFGYKGFVTISEGEAISTVQTRSGKTVDLGFSLRCEDFSVTHYPGGAPKEFKSILTVVSKEGVSVPGSTRVPVIVNDPLTYAGLTFYQSSYGKTGDHQFTVSGRNGGSTQNVIVPSQGIGRLPDGSLIRVAEATPDVAPFIPGMHGAAAQLEIESVAGGQKATFVSFANHRDENARNAYQAGGYVITYNGLTDGREYTGLQVTKDPGVWVVWVGCILMILGIYGAFLMSHRRIWIRITDTEVTVAGHANKNQAAFASKFEEFAEEVRRHISKEEKQ